MRQYCRYCCNAVPTGDDRTYCHVRMLHIPKSTACSPNDCKHFELNPIDVFDPYGGEKYKPRERKERDWEQTRMEV